MKMKSNDLSLYRTYYSLPGIYRNDLSNEQFDLHHSISPNLILNGVRSVNVTNDNRYLIITYEESIPRIRILDLEKLEFMQHDYSGHTDSVRMTRATNDNKSFYTASWDGSLRRYEIESGKCTRTLRSFGRCPSCFLEPEQKLLFSTSYDPDYGLESKNGGRCWDLVSGKIISFFIHTGERKYPESIDIAYDDGRVYTGSDDGCAYQWDLYGERPLMMYFKIKGGVRKLALSQNYFAASCTDGVVRVYFKDTGLFFREFFHWDQDVREVRISKDETRLWTATDGGTVSCFNLITGESVFCRKVHPLWIWSICLCRDEKVLVTGSGDGTVAFLSADSGEMMAQLYNLPDKNVFLITCPRDEAFPKGFFHTNDTGLIQVVREDNLMGDYEILEADDPVRKAYINKLNLKNLIITKLKNEKHYSSLTGNYVRNREILEQYKSQKLPYMLKSLQ